MGDVEVPLTACRRCRKQKLRCSREVPTCKRCQDISAVCDYPPPPDRKALAALRLQNARIRSRRESESTRPSAGIADPSPPPRETALSVPETSQESLWGRSNTTDDDHQGRSRPSDECLSPYPQLSRHAILRRTALPSPDVAMVLIEIYFQRMYNSHLLFHKASFLADYAADRVPDFLALSVFALATIFLREPQNQGGGVSCHQRDTNAVNPSVSTVSAADWARHGVDWATAAGQRVLMQCDTPRLETVQACQNVGLYWFALGKAEQCYIHTVIAYKVARLLKLHVQQDDSGSLSPVAAETARRCFWSCWVTSCFSQDNGNFKAEPWMEVINLPMPCSEASYVAGLPVSAEAWDDSGNLVSLLVPKMARQPSEYGELIKLLHLLWEIQNFGKQHGNGNSSDPSAKFAFLLELDRRLSNVIENFHPDLKYSAGAFASSKQEPHWIFQLHCVHRLCACALHSSIVPLFSATPSSTKVSQRLLRWSAEEAVKQSELCLDMATAFLETRPDISRLAGVSGYAMFVVATIHFKSLVAQRKLQWRGVGRMKAAVTILELLKSTWTVLDGPWSQMKTLFATAGLNIDIISCTQDSSQPGSDEPVTDLDKIISHKGNMRGSTALDLYTYISGQEVRAAPPHRHSDANSMQWPLSNNTTPHGSRAAIIADSEWRLSSAQPVSGSHRTSLPQVSPTQSSFAPPSQTIPPLPPTQLPLPQGFEQRFNSNFSTNKPGPPYLPQPFNQPNSTTQHFFYPPQQTSETVASMTILPRTLPEPRSPPKSINNPGNPTFHPRQPLTPIGLLSGLGASATTNANNRNDNPGYSLQGYPDPGVLALEMEIDAGGFWWDRSFVEADIARVVQDLELERLQTQVPAYAKHNGQEQHGQQQPSIGLGANQQLAHNSSHTQAQHIMNASRGYMSGEANSRGDDAGGGRDNNGAHSDRY